MTKKAKAPRITRRMKIVALAQEKHTDEGTLEVDDNAKLSEGDDNGTYVQAWVWVDFCGTEFCKATFDDHSDTECPVLKKQEDERDAAR